MYSKITYIEVQNFMVYNHAKVTFDETGAICLKGYNSSGKSSLLRAIAVCLMNEYKTKQTKYIKHGEDFFKIVIAFDDGIRIERMKFLSGQSLYEMYQNDECIFTTREGNKLTRVEEVPEIIEKYLGLIKLESGYLNYQNRKDVLYLVENTGAENYYSLNEVLKTESISKASAMLNSDKNKCNNDIADLEYQLQSTQSQLQDLDGIDQSLIDLLESKSGYCTSLEKQMSLLKGIYDSVSKIASIPVYPDFSPILSNRLALLQSIQGILKTLVTIPQIPALTGISDNRLEYLKSIQNLLHSISAVNTEYKNFDSLGLVRCGRLSSIIGIENLLGTILSANSQLNSIESKRVEISTQLKNLTDQCKLQGIEFVQCENCGSYMEVKR